jgi:hypothetical protein
VNHRLFRVRRWCDHLHRLSDGSPVEHECEKIPPVLMDLEAQGRPWAGPALERWKRSRGAKLRGVDRGPGDVIFKPRRPEASGSG